VETFEVIDLRVSVSLVVSVWFAGRGNALIKWLLIRVIATTIMTDITTEEVDALMMNYAYYEINHIGYFLYEHVD